MVVRNFLLLNLIVTIVSWPFSAFAHTVVDRHRSNVQISVSRAYAAQHGEPITWQALLDINNLGRVAVAPGGQYAAFVRLQANLDCHCYEHMVHIYNNANGTVSEISDLGQPFQSVLPSGSINGTLKPSALKWSHDGRYLAFVRNRAGIAKLSIYDTARKKNRDMETAGDPIYGFIWEPESHQILYQTGGPRPGLVAGYQRGLKDGFLFDQAFRFSSGMRPNHPLIPSIPPDRRGANAWDDFYHPQSALSVYKSVSINGEVQGGSQADELQFKALGGASVFGISYGRVFDQLPVDVQLLLRLNEQKDRLTISRNGTDYLVGCSSDPCPYAGKRVLKVFPGSNSGEFVVLRANSGGELKLSKVRWDEPSTGFIETFLTKFTRPSTGADDIDPVCDGDGGLLVCVIEDMNAPPYMAKIDLDDGAVTSIFDPNQSLRMSRYGRIERYEIDSTFSKPTYANLFYPVAYEPGQEYPLVILRYGASGYPRGQTGNEYPVLLFAEAGFFVLRIRDTGAKTPDQSLQKYAVHQRLFENIIAQLAEKGLVDPDRTGYGGLSSAANSLDYMLSNRFKLTAAISSTCCLGPDWMVGSPLALWEGFVERFYGGKQADPRHNPNYMDYWKRERLAAPMLHTEEFHTALLANSSEAEADAFKPMLTAMRIQKNPMEAYIYADEYHIKTKPSHRAAIYRRNVQWFKFWLKGEEEAKPVEPGQYERWREMRDEQCATIENKADGPWYCQAQSPTQH